MAISPARLAANRANALRSTGPRTLEGKARSSLNAVTQGLRSRQPLLLDEDPAEYEALAATLMEAFSPDGAVEELIAGQIVALAWRLRRAARIEVALFTVGAAGPVLEALRRSGEVDAAVGVAWSTHSTSFATLSKYEASLAARLHRALADLRQLQTEREADGPALVVVARRNE
jgi:hypothetical protein